MLRVLSQMRSDYEKYRQQSQKSVKFNIWT